MPPSTRLFWVTALAVCLAIARAAHAAEPNAEPATTPDQPPAAEPTKEPASISPKANEPPKSELGMSPLIDMEHAETFMDVSEAIRSRQYVHRTILSTVIRATTKFQMDRFYLNHIMGFSSVMQSDPVSRFSVGLQGLAGGYVSSGGHGIEAGVEVSAISNVYVGYRYFSRLESISLWPVFGFGAGMEVPALRISEPPIHPGGVLSTIPKTLFYGVFGLLIPLVDVGLRAEVRISVQGFKRIVLTQGLGVVIFL